MICPACGSTSLERLETCRRCGAPMAASAMGLPSGARQQVPRDPGGDVLELRLEPEVSSPRRRGPAGARRRPAPGEARGGDFVEMLDDDAIEVGEGDLDMALPGFHPVEDDGGPPFRIDDDLFAGCGLGLGGAPDVAASLAGQGASCASPAAELPDPAFALFDEESGIAAGSEPIIDRDGEIPERYWAPEVAGLGRRALALLVDQALLAGSLGVFFLGALLSLRLNGFDTDFLLAAAGLRAVAPPFALLAALLSLAYHAFFHGALGRTPGKALAGVEVRTRSGEALSWRRAVLRWFCSALGLACGGAGVVWALFEPRRRGWADLLSGTVIARRRRSAR